MLRGCYKALWENIVISLTVVYRVTIGSNLELVGLRIPQVNRRNYPLQLASGGEQEKINPPGFLVRPRQTSIGPFQPQAICQASIYAIREMAVEVCDLVG